MMILITKALCLPVGDSYIPVLLLIIKRPAQYWISLLLMLRLLILAIWLWRNLNWGEGGIIGWIGVTIIGVYLTERDI